MSFKYEISDKLKRILNKLESKDRILSIAVNKKIKQIINSDIDSINRFKNLKGNMSHLKRVHIGSFVLLFQVKGNKIFFESFVHHDRAY